VPLKLAAEKTDDRAADFWVPDLNLPIADLLPANYIPSETVGLEIYGRVARCRSEDDLEDLKEETARRFGRLPLAACDLFAAAKLRLDCSVEVS
jgi:transcription-repair coupling factor (superfamily II helicase)